MFALPMETVCGVCVCVCTWVDWSLKSWCAHVTNWTCPALGKCLVWG